MRIEDIHTLVARLLPSTFDIHNPQHNGILSLGFHALDDFVATSVAASSANIRAEIFNTFEGKLALPRTIANCRIKLDLAHDFSDERLIWFFAELALLRRSDGKLDEAEFSELNAWLHAQSPTDQSEAET